MRILGVFKEEFGEVWIYTKKLGIEFMSLSSIQIGIKKTNSSKLIDINIKNIELNNSYPEFSILLPILLYLHENSVGTELRWAGNYKKLSKLIIENRWIPIALFCNKKKEELKNLTTILSEKALLLNSKNIARHTDYKDVVVPSDLNAINLTLNNQSLLWLKKGNGKIEGTNKSRIIFLGEFEGDLSSYEIHLGSSSQLKGNIEAERLSIDKGAIVNGQVSLKN